MSKVTGTLENWVKKNVGKDVIYFGYIIGDAHGRWRDGTWMHTSRVVKPKRTKEGDTINTLNSTYKLGTKGGEFDKSMLLPFGISAVQESRP